MRGAGHRTGRARPVDPTSPDKLITPGFRAPLPPFRSVLYKGFFSNLVPPVVALTLDLYGICFNSAKRKIARHGPGAYQTQSPISNLGNRQLAKSDEYHDGLNMTTATTFHASDSIRTLRFLYWPAFEVTVHELPQDNVRELY